MKKTLALVLITGFLLLSGCIALSEEASVTHTSGYWKYVVQEDGTACITDWRGVETTPVIPDALDGMAVTGIGDRAFRYRTSLTSITIPDSVASIGANPFDCCRNLHRVIVSPEHPTLAVIDGMLFCKTNKQLVGYPKTADAQRYTIPQGITSIVDYAFNDCPNLTLTVSRGSYAEQYAREQNLLFIYSDTNN